MMYSMFDRLTMVRILVTLGGYVVKGVEFGDLLGEKTLELECLELVFNLLSSDKYCFTGYKWLH